MCKLEKSVCKSLALNDVLTMLITDLPCVRLFVLLPILFFLQFSESLLTNPSPLLI